MPGRFVQHSGPDCPRRRQNPRFCRLVVSWCFVHRLVNPLISERATILPHQCLLTCRTQLAAAFWFEVALGLALQKGTPESPLTGRLSEARRLPRSMLNGDWELVICGVRGTGFSAVQGGLDSGEVQVECLSFRLAKRRAGRRKYTYLCRR